MGVLSGLIASNGLTPTYVNGAVNASAGKLYQCDTSAGAFTVTLPTGTTGAVMRFVDDQGTWGTHALTIAPAASQTIQGISGSGSLVCNLSGAYVEFTWDATNSWWVVQSTGFQYGPTLSASQAGIMPASNTGLDDASATRLGLKQYLSSGSYNGGGAPTVTIGGGGTLTAVTRGTFLPYQTNDGTWRLKLSLVLSVSSAGRTVLSVTVNGITLKNVTAFYQPIECNTTTGSMGVAGYGSPGTGTFNCDSTGAPITSTLYVLGGDVELDSKPTWAF